MLKLDAKSLTKFCFKEVLPSMLYIIGDCFKEAALNKKTQLFRNSMLNILTCLTFDFGASYL
jgi:hypothetical protein